MGGPTKSRLLITSVCVPFSQIICSLIRGDNGSLLMCEGLLLRVLI